MTPKTLGLSDKFCDFQMEISFCDTLNWIPIIYPQGDPLEAVPGSKNQFYLELQKLVSIIY